MLLSQRSPLAAGDKNEEPPPSAGAAGVTVISNVERDSSIVFRGTTDLSLLYDDDGRLVDIFRRDAGAAADADADAAKGELRSIVREEKRSLLTCLGIDCDNTGGGTGGDLGGLWDPVYGGGGLFDDFWDDPWGTPGLHPRPPQDGECCVHIHCEGYLLMCCWSGGVCLTCDISCERDGNLFYP